MKQYRLINKLDCSKNQNKDIALKFDVGKVKGDKYGEAMLSGYFLLMNRAGDFPNVNVKLIKERSFIWLNEMGLEDYPFEVFEKAQIPTMVAYTAADGDPDKLELYFKVSTFMLLLEIAVIKLKHLNKNDPAKQQEDILKIVESLISIMENHGDGNSTAATAFQLNPMFKSLCTALSHVCHCSFQQMYQNNYKHFIRELMDHIRSSKWIQEYHNSAYTENEYFFLRCIDIGLFPIVEPVCFANDIRICEEIRMHPLFQRYNKNIAIHIALTNDILSLRKEMADNERENLVLVKCQKYSLQRSIRKTVKAANEVIIDLKNDGIKLKLYFPSDYALKKYIRAMEVIIDGFLYWYVETKRYGNIKYEKYEVKYDFDGYSWIEQTGTNTESMKEPVLRGE